MNSPTISDDEPERNLTEALDAYWKRFFTGTSIQLGARAVKLPVVDILFNQTTPPQPSTRPQIHTIISDIGHGEHRTNATDSLHRRPVTLTIYVRTSAPGQGSNTADFECRRVADAVRQLFDRSERLQLSAAGILNARCRKGPVPIPTPGVQTRMIIATAILTYRVTE